MSSNLESSAKRKNQSIIHTIEKPNIVQNMQAALAQAQAQSEIKVAEVVQQKQPEVQVQPEPIANTKNEEVKIAPILNKPSPPKEVNSLFLCLLIIIHNFTIESKEENRW